MIMIRLHSTSANVRISSAHLYIWDTTKAGLWTTDWIMDGLWTGFIIASSLGRSSEKGAGYVTTPVYLNQVTMSYTDYA